MVIFRTFLIVLLSTLIKLSNCASINKFDSVRPLNSFNSVYSRSPSLSPSSSSSSSSSSSATFSKIPVKREPTDFDYNQDAITGFEHPFNLFKSSEDKRTDELNSNKDDQLNYQQLNTFPNRRMTRIRFLTGQRDQPNRLAKKQSDNLLNESDQPFNTAYVTPKRNYAPILRRNRNQYPLASQFYNQQPWFDQQSKRNSYDLSDYQPTESFGSANDLLNGQPIKNRRSKKALSLFAHWKPLDPYLSGNPEFPLNFKTPVRKAHISPILRWG